MPHFFGRDTARRVQARQSRADGRFLRAHGRQASGVFGFAHRPLWRVVGQRGLIRIGSRPHTLCLQQGPSKDESRPESGAARCFASLCGYWLPMLVPLFIWMYAQTQRRRPRLAVDLAKASQAASLQRSAARDAMFVWVSHDSAIHSCARSSTRRARRRDSKCCQRGLGEARVFGSRCARGTRTSTGPVEIRKAGIENVSIVTHTPLLPPDQKVVLRFPPGFRKPVPVRPITP